MANDNTLRGEDAIAAIRKLHEEGLFIGRLCSQAEEARHEGDRPKRGLISAAKIEGGVLKLWSDTIFGSDHNDGPRTKYFRTYDHVLAEVQLDENVSFSAWSDGYFISHTTGPRLTIT